MKYFTQSMTLLGTVTVVNPDPEDPSFTISCRSGDIFPIHVSSQTNFDVLRNLDEVDRDRVLTPKEKGDANLSEKVAKYVRLGDLIFVRGIRMDYEDRPRHEARNVTLLHYRAGEFLFEETHWWLNQISRMGEEWLDGLFGDRRSYQMDDFAALYRSNLNILGLPVGDNDIQECATLSRLIYGLSSAYLLTGHDRFLFAAKAGIKYQRDTFRSLSHDGKCCIWCFGKKKTGTGARIIVASENEDDKGTIPLYEQIYALAGMAQYYRITQDWEVLEDIERTVNAFQTFYLDSTDNGYERQGGYFSHIDYTTMRADAPVLDKNQSRKNWNSIGDHIPAYLVNLILALDPPPHSGAGRDKMEHLLHTCLHILDTTANLIIEKFPDKKNPQIPYVNERFKADWTPDQNWVWQQNRAIIGHNLKIAWNLTRVHNFFHRRAARERREGEKDLAQQHEGTAKKFLELAEKLGKAMVEHGLDQIRGGCFDAVERDLKHGLPIEFTWLNTKDFWQQEQGILAYLILHGATGDPEYLQLAREMAAFWNMFFLDHDHRGIFFRVTAEGRPVIEGIYGQKAGHSVAGYHSFELNYLAHIYIRSYVKGKSEEESNFCLFFFPDKDSGCTTINVLPDFFGPDTLEVANIKVNGVPRPSFSPDNFQVDLAEEELNSQVVVEFRPKKRNNDE